MIIKCTLEDNSVVFKNFSLEELHYIVDTDRILDYLKEKIGSIEEWYFSKFGDIEVDIRNFIDIDCVDINFKINDKSIEKFEFLEEDGYEHIISSFSTEKVKKWNYMVGINYTVNEQSDDWEPEDPYGDDGPEYDETYGL